MQKVKNTISTRHLLTLYYSLIYPYTDYGITIWRTHETYVKNYYYAEEDNMINYRCQDLCLQEVNEYYQAHI